MFNKNIDNAMQSFQKQDFQQAIAEFNAYLQQSPNDTYILNNIGLCYSYLANYEKANQYYIKALSIDYNLPQTVINLTDNYLKTNQILNAIEILQKAVYNIPDNNLLKHYLARVYIQDRRFNEAIDILNDLLDREPNNIDASWDLAQIFFELGNWECAIVNYENVLKSKHDNELILFQTGLAYEANDELDKALSCFLKANLINEKFPLPYKKIAKIFMIKGDTQNAIEYFKNYLKFNIPDKQEQLSIQHLINQLKSN